MISLASTWVHPTRGFSLDPLTLGCHLGRISRFGGTTSTWWPVLGHSLFVAAMMEQDGLAPRLCLAGLLHDGHEFLRGDVPTDWKTEGDRGAEVQIDDLICGALGVPIWMDAERQAVKPYDRDALIVEGNIIARQCLEMMPEKYSRPDLVLMRSPILHRFYLPGPMDAFYAYWEPSFYPQTFAGTFERLKERCR